jgi:hypothetical protein
MLPNARAGHLTGESPSAVPAARGRGKEYVRALEDTARAIRNPVVKLRYLRACMDGQHRFDRIVRHVPFALLRRGLYRWLSLELLRTTLTRRARDGGSQVPPSSRRALVRARLSVACTAASLLAVVTAASYVAVQQTRATVLLADAYQPTPTPEPVAQAEPTPAPEAEPLATTRGVAPERIWLVEQGKGFELYSNGLRIDTRYAVAGEQAREYRVMDAGTGQLSEELFDRPRGILFHTSESDIWPLEEGFNDDLRNGTHRLLRYLARNHVYHYLVDRFGRVFRVVHESDKANHAGYSIWARGDEVFVSLNNAFLAVSFESQWEGGLTLPITQAQYAGGLNLTNMLRDRYDIVPELCVAHGLASVNPRKHLIGHHLDWARGFPFEEWGLPDQYQVPTPAVRLFGFAWDETVIEALGEPWPGVRAAEADLRLRALRARKDLWDFRRERQKTYDEWIAGHYRDEERRAEARRTGKRAERAWAPEPSGG